MRDRVELFVPVAGECPFQAKSRLTYGTQMSISRFTVLAGRFEPTQQDAWTFERKYFGAKGRPLLAPAISEVELRHVFVTWHLLVFSIGPCHCWPNHPCIFYVRRTEVFKELYKTIVSSQSEVNHPRMLAEKQQLLATFETK